MKICILKESLSIGGTERSAANISRILSQKHEVDIALFNGQDIQYAYGGKLVDFGCPVQNGIWRKIANTLARHQKLKHLLKQDRVDILYQFIGVSNPIIRFRYPDVIKIISARDFGAMRDKHADYKKALDLADGMICNSGYIRDFFLNIYPEDSEKVFTAYNIIDSKEILSQSQSEPEPEFLSFVQEHSHTIVSAGRFCREKGFECLIRAVAQVREKVKGIGLILIGDGDYRTRYEQLIRDYQLEDHVYFTGFQKNPYRYMYPCTCFVLSSLSEGFPNVLAEAMALGLPVIADNCYSGPAEILRADGDYDAVSDQFSLCDYGILTPRIKNEEDLPAIQELGNALVALLSDKELVRHYADSAKERALDFSGKIAAERLSNIFMTLMREKGK